MTSTHASTLTPPTMNLQTHSPSMTLAMSHSGWLLILLWKIIWTRATLALSSLLIQQADTPLPQEW